MSLAAFGQRSGSYLTIEGKTGLSGYNYKLLDGSQNSKLGFGGKIGYSYFFDKHLGIGTGLEITSYSTEGSLKNYLVSFNNQIDDEGYNYRKDVYLLNWKENQKAMFFEVPLYIQVQNKFGTEQKHGYYFNLGFKFQMPVISKYEVTEGDIETQGYYPQWNVTLHSLPKHGFGVNNDFKPSGNTTLKFNVAGSAELGFLFGLSDRVDLTVGAYCDYGILNMKKNDEGSLVYQDNNNNIAYRDMLSSNLVDKVHPLSVGGKIGVRIKLGTITPLESNKYNEELERLKAESAAVTEALLKAEKARQEADDKREEAEKQREAAEIARLEAEKSRIEAEKARIEFEQNRPVIKTKGDEPAMITEEKIQTIDGEFTKLIVSGYNIDQTELSSELKTVLDYDIEEIKKMQNLIGIICVGYTCDIGSEKTNKLVGLLRAEAVEAYMVERGVDSKIISIKSKGQIDPSYINSCEENRRQNRRVELILIVK